ncbi:Enoyl-acyl-carrier-protein reductase, mitochondrial [Hondaea fermentalgiana]|uniref:Enoyl-acyl-carrier-protein reductase, mitochondrial n=1 Tax=Hondaea fermentalgiana TaxID=2315210 RepID=A0A2R5G8L1_9STRA|nr:Enoyl-acyl-carrier-protein reductase, mitochondrial [Hondaea fermentalgiana]|eukprot:GBG26669.1 Enoyl-acyl-carrier-protein reductase, mitochondrial [Hondaea fermentalgiana]
MPGLMTLLLVAVAAGAALLGGVSNELYYNPKFEVPKEMWAVQTVAPGELEVRRVPVPVPQKGEILIKVHYTTVNPSDMYNALGTAGYRAADIKYPYGIGYEGSGEVVASGGGVPSYILAKLGTAVAAVSVNFSGQFWAEYAISAPSGILPLPSNVDYKEGAATFINPLTALSMLEIAKEGHHKALVHTAANSALGLQLIRAAPVYDVDVVCVVRGEKNVKILKEHNVPADLIVRTDVESFKTDLSKAVQKYDATLAFDAIAGDVSSDIYEVMPDESVVLIYGNLSGQGVPEELRSKKNDPKKPSYFFLVGPWLEEGGIMRQLKVFYRLFTMLPKELATKIDRVLGLKDDNLVDVLKSDYQTGGKMVIKTIMD